MPQENIVYMMYDIKEDKGVVRKIAQEFCVPSRVEKDIIEHIENNIDQKKAEKVVENCDYDVPLVKIGRARFEVPDDIEFIEEEYKVEGDYKYADGYKVLNKSR